VIGVNPVRTGYNAIADEWLGITPGTDGLLILALMHELCAPGKIDLDYLIRYTNAPWLVIDAPGTGRTTGFSRATRRATRWWPTARPARCALERETPGVKPALKGRRELPDGRKRVAGVRTAGESLSRSEYAPAAVAERPGSRPTPSAASPAKSPMWPSSAKW
jgi:anaerobic selenocysteine-containing dehydrogenase